MAARFELKRSRNGKFMFNLLAANGQIVLTSQVYSDRQGALAGIESVINNAKLEENFEHKVAANGLPFFTLRAMNEETIGRSELYASRSGMRNGIESVMRSARNSKIVEI